MKRNNGEGFVCVLGQGICQFPGSDGHVGGALSSKYGACVNI